jgi:hypothetical protein
MLEFALKQSNMGVIFGLSQSSKEFRWPGGGGLGSAGAPADFNLATTDMQDLE